MKFGLRLSVTVLAVLVAAFPSRGMAEGEEGSQYYQCLQGASYAFAYCGDHCPPYSYAECSRDYDWTVNACGQQFPHQLRRSPYLSGMRELSNELTRHGYSLNYRRGVIARASGAAPRPQGCCILRSILRLRMIIDK